MPNDANESDDQLTVTIPDAVARTRLSRSTLYRLAGTRQIKMVKARGRTLVDWASLKAFAAGLPAADLKGAP